MLSACKRHAVLVFFRKPSRVGALELRRCDHSSPECTTEAEETMIAV